MIPMSGHAMTANDQAEQGGAPPGFAALLRELDEGEEQATDISSDPGAAFRSLYDGWVKRGGSERGKRRHSVRQIKEWLGKKDQVLSLETKLAGKTWLQFSDALNLLKLFLSYWTYDEAEGKYEPYEPSGELDDTARQFLVDLFPEDEEAILLPDRGKKTGGIRANDQESFQAASSALQVTTPSRDAIPNLFAQSDVLIIVGRARAVIGPNPAAAMTAFHDLIERLYKTDVSDGRQRALVWIIDFGLRSDKENARAAIYNFYFLIAQFRAIALIERSGREEFYAWLLENACVIVGSLRFQEIDRVYGEAKIKLPSVPPDLMWFQSDRLFLESIPGRWIESEGSEAFGRSQRELWEIPTISVHLKLDDWPLDQLVAADSEIDIRRNLRYLFHAEVVPPPEDPREASVRCITLPEPGSRWSDAHRMAVQAAFDRLGRAYDERAGSVKPREALAALRSQHFAVLRLAEFLNLAHTLVDQRQDSLNERVS